MTNSIVYVNHVICDLFPNISLFFIPMLVTAYIRLMSQNTDCGILHNKSHYGFICYINNVCIKILVTKSLLLGLNTFSNLYFRCNGKESSIAFFKSSTILFLEPTNWSLRIKLFLPKTQGKPLTVSNT